MMHDRNADTIPTQCAVRRRTTHIRALGGEGARNLEYDDVARIPLFHGVDLRLYCRDILDRIDKIESVDGLSQWVYDTKAAGKLSIATSAFGVQTEYDYDELKRLRDTTWTVHGETFKVTTTYDALDRVDTLAFPEVAGLGRTTVQQKYNAYGYAERIDDVSPGQQGKTIWQAKERNHEGELVRSVTGDKLVTTNAYDDLSGQLEGIRVQTPNGADVYHVGMLYDEGGRMEARTDYVENRQEDFWHDDLSRLRQWTLQSPGKGVTTSAYSYDRLSSLEKVERNGVVQQHYAHGNAGRPRAIQHDYTPQGAYTYDHRARVTQGGGRSMMYSDADLPTSVTTPSGTTQFEYDAANQRVVKTSPDEKTIYIGGVYERRESASSTVHVFHIGGIADIVYDANAVIPRETLYVHGDALGSTSLVTDEMGNERERLFYAPFGARVDIDGNPPTGPPSDVRNGFTGHRHDDELGLIDMRGRVFDTKTSRFPTPDPLIADSMFSPSLNRFAYVHQSPLNWVDPTGFNPETTRRAEWFASVNAPGINLAPTSGVGLGAGDVGLVQDITAGIAGMQFPAGSDAVNTSGCPKGTGTAPRPCAAPAQAGCPSGSSITDSWGFRFTKGMVTEAGKGMIATGVRTHVAFLTQGRSEIALALYSKGSAIYGGYERGGFAGASEAFEKEGSPIEHVRAMGSRFLNAVDGDDPEELGAASLPVAATVVALVAGRLRIVPEHHIATVKNVTSSVRGGPWTPRFEDIFGRAGMSMEDVANRVRIPGHKGPHPQAYHEYVFERLNSATKGLSGIEAEAALRSELVALRSQLLIEGSFLNRLVTRK